MIFIRNRKIFSAIAFRGYTAFSLIELLIVVVLMSIMTGAVVVSLQGRKSAHILGVTARDLAGAISYAFEESRLSGIAHRVSFSDDGASYRVEAATGDELAPYQPVSGLAGRPKRFAGDVKIVGVTYTSSSSRSECSELLCIPGPSGFDGIVELQDSNGEVIMLEVLGGTGQVHVRE